VRNFGKHGLPRTKAQESAVLHIIAEIKNMRRRDMNKTDKFRLEGEDIREDKEFRQNVIESLSREICRMLPGRPDAQFFNPRDHQQQ
jgi:peptide-N4-(N-acetyl-beta-glucosaminyl)asparagine amidase